MCLLVYATYGQRKCGIPWLQAVGNCWSALENALGRLDSPVTTESPHNYRAPYVSVESPWVPSWYLLNVAPGSFACLRSAPVFLGSHQERAKALVVVSFSTVRPGWPGTQFHLPSTGIIQVQSPVPSPLPLRTHPCASPQAANT